MQQQEGLKNIGFGFMGDHNLEEFVELFQTTEQMGFASAWLAEDYYYAGAFTLAATLAAHTSTIDLGIGVLNPYTRHPALIAMETAALDKVSNGRAILGIGSSNKRWIEMQMGIPHKKPLTAMKECTEIVKTIVRDSAIDGYDGALFQVNGIKLDFEPYRKDLPVYLGVQGEKSLFTAGQIADGVLLSAGCSVEFVSHAKARIAEGAKSVGRDPAEIKIAVYLPMYVGDSHESAVEEMREYARHYVSMHGEKPIITLSGIPAEEVAPFRAATLAGTVCHNYVTDKMVQTVMVVGTAQEVRARVQEYIDAGADMPICFEVGGEIDTMQQLQRIKDALL